LDVVSAAKAFGCPSVLAKTKQEIKQAFSDALKADGPNLIAIPIARQERPLVAD
jgi:thiamine pyrophosphate-dependent acetolactate synthase large subunit-like protein